MFSERNPYSRQKGTAFGSALNVVLLTVATAAFSLQALSYRYISDDAFISFRYARNWAIGNGPVYNIGETVEGYTNFLWMAILAGLHRLGMDIVLAAQVLGIALGVATILLTFKFSLRWHRASSLWAVLAACLLALNVSFAAYGTGGLETHLFTFLVLLSALLHVQELEKPTRFPWSGLIMALCVMTRPDGLVFVGLSGVHRLWVHRGRITRQDLLWGLTFALLYVPYYVWRFSYYGYPFPNTFYAKYGGGPERLLRGLEHVAGFLWEYGGGPFALLAGLLVILGKLEEDCWYLALLVGGFLAYVIWIGGDSLIEYRFLLAVTPLLYLLIQQSLWRIQDAIGRWLNGRVTRPDLVRLLLSGVLLATLTYLLVAQPTIQRSRQRVVQTRIEYEDFAAVGKWLRKQVPEEASLAVHHAGAMPFYSELTSIDMYGLTDSHIAHRAMPNLGKGYAGHEKYDVDYVLSRQPTYIAPLPLRNRALSLENWGRFVDNPWFPDMKEMLPSARFQADYAPRSVDLTGHVSPKEGTVFNFFQLRDASLAEEQSVVWDFGQDGGLAGWSPWSDVHVQEASETTVLWVATGADSHTGISRLRLWATPCDKLTVRMRVTAGTAAQVYWLTDLVPHGSEFQSLTFQVEPDGMFHTYSLAVGDALSWAGTITGLRLDPTDQPAEIEIDYIRFDRLCRSDSLEGKLPQGRGDLL